MIEEQEQALWLAVRQACLMIVACIERIYGLSRKCPHCKRPI